MGQPNAPQLDYESAQPPVPASEARVHVKTFPDGGVTVTMPGRSQMATVSLTVTVTLCLTGALGGIALTVWPSLRRATGLDLMGRAVFDKANGCVCLLGFLLAAIAFFKVASRYRIPRQLDTIAISPTRVYLNVAAAMTGRLVVDKPRAALRGVSPSDDEPVTAPSCRSVELQFESGQPIRIGEQLGEADRILLLRALQDAHRVTARQ